jgi:hypothetical protein
MGTAFVTSMSVKKSSRWLWSVLVWLLLLVSFSVIYTMVKRVTVNEVRFQAMGIAIATAQGIDAADIESIRTEADMSTEAFHRVQNYISDVSRYNPDVRYIYTMRRSTMPDASSTAFEFVVDQTPRDMNNDGIIQPDEASEPTCSQYDASALPELVKAWAYPSADPDVSADPPYPDLISGYAPITNNEGETAAIVGVDITAGTISGKLQGVRLVLIIFGLLSGTLSFLVIHLFLRQKQILLEQRQLLLNLNKALLTVRTLKGLLPICSMCKKVRNDTGYWELIEEYIGTHSDAEFTHSLCPECIAKHYPEFKDTLEENLN